MRNGEKERGGRTTVRVFIQPGQRAAPWRRSQGVRATHHPRRYSLVSTSTYKGRRDVLVSCSSFPLARGGLTWRR